MLIFRGLWGSHHGWSLGSRGWGHGGNEQCSVGLRGRMSCGPKMGGGGRTGIFNLGSEVQGTTVARHPDGWGGGLVLGQT